MPHHPGRDAAETRLSGAMLLRFSVQFPGRGPSPGGEDAVKSAGILENAYLPESLSLLADPSGELSFVGLMLEEDPAAGGEELGGFAEDAAVEVEPVGAAIDRQVRLVFGNCSPQDPDPTGRDVGGVRDDHIERPVGGEAGDRLEQVALGKGHAVGDAVTTGISPRHGQARGADISGDDRGCGHLQG